VRAVSGDEILDEVTLDLTLRSLLESSSSKLKVEVGGGVGKQVSALIGALGW
jgi:hypothetical protein